MEFISSTTRDKLFVVGTLLLTFTLIFRALISVLVRNEVFSIYRLISNDYHWTTSSLSFLAVVLAEVMIFLDLEVHCIFNFSTLYISLVGMRFWLQRIWWVIILHEYLWSFQFYRFQTSYLYLMCNFMSGHL